MLQLDRRSGGDLIDILGSSGATERGVSTVVRGSRETQAVFAFCHAMPCYGGV